MRVSQLKQWVRMVFRRHSTGQRPRPRGRPRLSLEFLEDRTVPSTVNWINPGGGDWDTASNWQDAATGANRVPGANDDAVIGFNGIIVTHNSSASDSVHSLTSQGTLSVSNGSLSFAADSSTQGLTLSGGTVGVLDSADLDVRALLRQTGGTLTGPGTVTSDTLWTWTGGTEAGAGDTVNNGTANLGSVSVFGPTLDTRTVDNNGTATLSDNTNLSFANLATWNNLSGATLVLGNSDTLGFFGGSGQVNNAGLLLKEGAFPGNATVSVPVDNTGTVDVQLGSLTLSGGLTNEGTYALEPGTSASVNGTLLNGSSSGTFSVGSGSVLTFTGTSFTLLAGAQVDTDPGSQLVVNSTVTQQAGAQVTLGTGSVLNVSFSGNYILADGAAVDGPGLVELTNGQMMVTGAADVSNLYIANGTLTLAAPADLEVQNLTQTGGTLTGTGTATVNGQWTWTGGTEAGAGDTVNNGTATLSSGSFSSITLNARTVDNNGTATLLDNATINFANLATWNNLSGATLVLGNNISLGGFNPSGQLNNYGFLQDSGPTGHATIGFAVLNSGTVNLQGILNISGSYTQTANGTFVTNLGPGSPPTAGQLNVSGPAALDGTLAVKTLPGFFPVANQSFLIMMFSSLVGDFATFTGLDLGGGLHLVPMHSNTTYTFTVSAA